MSTVTRPGDSAPASSPTTSAPKPRRPRWLALPLIVVGILLLVSVPFWVAPYPVLLLSRILSFALLVISVDLLTGYTGLPTLGQVAYFGAGAYTAGLVGIHLSTNAFLQLLLGTLVAAALALVTGAVAVRTNGFVFLMVTLAITELANRQADSMTAVTGGSNGLSGIPAVTLTPGGEPLRLAGLVYFWVLFVFLIGLALAIVLVRSPLGRSMRGVRDAESRLHALGQRSYPVKLMAYTFAGAIAGMAGTAWTAQARFFSPGDMAFSLAAIALLSVVLGGAGTLWGPILAAAIVIFIRDYVGAMVNGHGATILGLLFVVAVFALPRGIAGLVRRRRGPTLAVAGEGDAGVEGAK
ncbi:branched-chain amino acid ABC transporter permease [Enemella evansiae]|uniref:Inner-membrane translocator n=1 Tax=Enemella evansiae TaxID=2016499 RepID=A0A255GBT1_9ACTN|nr:branched-chain amino acid ABC transporter permease [Enemella evansiae]PFG68473.1 branched-chain amino acid transport system permease protein [Propionibacteriaceae bacterium ES.041]OYN95492.1 inner-membrane translocator [Enemella evansiae]OYO01655.1 inner-membrane translocator [Enemella evansiae]OYO03600.1 inner-membrane translocator [Enemella evansiae]OYO13370.1 inner-membrane translocator [Enemella evansiae]